MSKRLRFSPTNRHSTAVSYALSPPLGCEKALTRQHIRIHPGSYVGPACQWSRSHYAKLKLQGSEIIFVKQLSLL